MVPRREIVSPRRARRPPPPLGPSRPAWIVPAFCVLAGLAAGALLFRRGDPPPASTVPPTPAPAAPARAIFSTAPEEPRAPEPARASYDGPVLGTFEALGFSGHGTQQTRPFTLESGTYVVDVTHRGSGAYAVRLLEEASGTGEWVANGTGQGSSRRGVRVGKRGQYVLSVSADGDWTATIDLPGVRPAPGSPAAPRPTPTTSPDDWQRLKLERELEEARRQHDWIVEHAPPNVHSPEADEAARRANELARELGRPQPY